MKKTREVFNEHITERYETPIWNIKCSKIEDGKQRTPQVLRMSSLFVPSIPQSNSVFEEMLLEEYENEETVCQKEN